METISRLSVSNRSINSLREISGRNNRNSSPPNRPHRHFSGTISDPGVAAEPITLEADECFVMGDNPGGSEDSRFANIGNVKSDYIIGKAWYKIWPLSDAGFVD